MVYTENAPELEKKFHHKFNENRVNSVNIRREFFKVTMNEIEEFMKELKMDVQLTKVAEAKEFRMTQSIKESKAKNKISKPIEIFPNSL